MINKCQFRVLSSHYSVFTDLIYAKSIFIGLYVLENCGTVDNSFMVYVFCKAHFFMEILCELNRHVLLIIKIKKYRNGLGSAGVIQGKLV